MPKTIFISLLLIIFSLPSVSYSQAVDKPEGHLVIKQDSRIQDLLTLDKKKSSLNYSFKGYRVQIFSGRSTQKNKAIEAKNRFLDMFPNHRAYVIYKAPDFRVRVGNFRTQFETVELYSKLKEFFPKAYIVKTLIPISSLSLPDDYEEEVIEE